MPDSPTRLANTGDAPPLQIVLAYRRNWLKKLLAATLVGSAMWLCLTLFALIRPSGGLIWIITRRPKNPDDV
jgi:hypothetical protein